MTDSTFIPVRDNRGITYVARLASPVPASGYRPEAPFVGFWFNRYERSWVVALYTDSEGRDQVGASDYVYSRSEAEEIAFEVLVTAELRAAA